MNPFAIEGPAVVSFSGGRTSGYMLRQILDAGLRPDVHVMFANTGKEHEATLAFVRDCAERWSVPIAWLEYERRHLPVYKSKDREAAARRAREIDGRTYLPPSREEPGYRIVSFATAARRGEPFENLIDINGLPGPLTRLCSKDLKTRIIYKHMMSFGYDYWDNVVGIRADEPKRIAQMRLPTRERYENLLPLAEAGVAKPDVLAFWRAQPFDLGLPVDENGDTAGGNCDLCFLKGVGKRQRLAKADPARVAWWAHQEARTGMTFRDHRPTYAALLAPSASLCLWGDEDDDLGDCTCHD